MSATHTRRSQKHRARTHALYTWTCTGCGTESTGGLLTAADANAQWAKHMTETLPRQADCQNDECGETHVAEFSHYSQFGGHPVWAVVCTQDNLTDYYTEEGLR